MFNFHKNHRSLILAALTGFLTLSIIIAVIPASQMQSVQPLPDQQEMTQEEIRGLELYISEGCVACHTQQVRNIAMDEVWGERPSMPSDYYYSKQRLDFWRQSPSLLGSERTGPDLTNVGLRQPGAQWHLLHLYNPRIVVKESVMPAYPWLFKEKKEEDISEEDTIIPVGKDFFNKPGYKVVATKGGLNLVAYLQSLKQTELPGNNEIDFIPLTKEKKNEKQTNNDENHTLPDGEKLYMQTCSACHQKNGQGLAGAFPPLAGSSVVMDEDPELLIKIILQGYDARSEYGQMPSFATQLTDEEITAIINHERKSWGNDASPVTVDKVGEIRKFIMENL